MLGRKRLAPMLTEAICRNAAAVAVGVAVVA